jgi:hypothetical protein
MHRDYKIKSKQTLYGNNLFRSILEARWAVFFDSLGIEYTYEPYCFGVETGGREVTYKPDFFLPKLEIFIEIKPSKPFDIENTKAAAWSKHIGDIIILFNLNPPTKDLENGWKFSCETPSGIPTLSESYTWCECPKCGHIDLANLGELTSCGCYSLADFNRMYEIEEARDIIVSPDFEKTFRLLTAYKRAKKYSFRGKGSEKALKLPTQLSLF